MNEHMICKWIYCVWHIQMACRNTDCEVSVRSNNVDSKSSTVTVYAQYSIVQYSTEAPKRKRNGKNPAGSGSKKIKLSGDKPDELSSTAVAAAIIEKIMNMHCTAWIKI